MPVRLISKRARDRGGGEREHVDVGLQLLDRLLVAHAEPLLLVDHEQSQALEADVLGEQPVRADDDVDLAVADAVDDPLRLPGREEP